MSIDTGSSAPTTDHRSVWAMGDYALMAEQVMAPLGPILVDAAGIGPGVRVLDVAAGSGNISLPAAKAGASVVSTDLTPELLQRSRGRADQQGLTLEYKEANAEALPFDDNEFDVVISAIGVMFAPDHRKAASELVRVCRPGGTIGVISWTPEGWFGQMLSTIRPFRTEMSPGFAPPALWGRPEYLRGLLGDRVGELTTRKALLPVERFGTAEAVHDYFKNHYGPTLNAYRQIGDNPVLASGLDAQLIDLAHKHLDNAVMGWEYLLSTARKK
jgi:ubiquinone/menaquinone biosynthesis C-methylase UbiE